MSAPGRAALESCRREVERTLRAAAAGCGPERRALLRDYMKSELDFLGLTVPRSRELHRRGYSFSGWPEPRLAAAWEHVWKTSRIYDAMSQAVLFLESRCRGGAAARLWPRARTWAGRIENWAHSDGLSKFYNAALEAGPARVLPHLRRWNRSPNPWLRRQSVVSLLYYASPRRPSPLSFAELRAFVHPLRADPRYYVRKGVGWTLREMHRLYPRETLAYVEETALELPPQAFSTAVERVPPSVRERLKRLRRDRAPRRRVP